nr:carotenoid oxygenase family protein [Mycobacterium eburneum]
MPTPLPAPGPLLSEFTPLHTEHDYLLDDEFGAVPPGLRGTLYRNGAGRWESGGSPVGHIFDGDGMLSMFVFDQGGVRFRNRYVRTNHYLRGNHCAGPAGRNTGTMRGNGSFWANAFRWPLSNLANTNAVLHAGHLLALYEAGKPHAIDPDTLATRGVYDFDGKLRGLGSFSAHPKIDPRTGELFNFGTAIYPFPCLVVYRVDPNGRLHKLTRVPMLPPLLNHDVGLTDRYVVLVLDPLVASPTGMIPVLAGLKPLVSAIRFDPDLGTKIVLVPRDGGRAHVAHTEALLHFHLANCYDDGADTVIELCRYTDTFDTVWQYLHTGYNRAQTKPGFGGPLTRLRVTGTGRVLREDLTDQRTEFPQIDTRFTGRRHRYSYTVRIPEFDLGSAVSQHGNDEIDFSEIDFATVSPRIQAGVTAVDHDRGTESTYPVDNFGTAGEPVFAPSSPDAPEGHGWLLTIEYDRVNHRSKLVVLDAREPARGPVYVGGLRHHLPAGIHGSFTHRVATPG